MVIAVYITVILALLAFQQTCTQAARDALIVWGLQVTPSLFPYMVFSKLLAGSIKTTRVSQAGLCAILGVIGGSPSGAAMIAESMKSLSVKSTLALCAFTGTISPMFFMGTINNWTGDARLAGQLYVTHVLSAAITSAWIWCFTREQSSFASDIICMKRNGTPLTQSIDALLQVGGCIICFSVFASLLGLIPFMRPITPILHALCEISGGVYSLLHTAMETGTKRIVLAAVTGFGSFSILAQNLIFLKPAGINAGILIKLALMRSLFSALIMTVLYSC